MTLDDVVANNHRNLDAIRFNGDLQKLDDSRDVKNFLFSAAAVTAGSNPMGDLLDADNFLFGADDIEPKDKN